MYRKGVYYMKNKKVTTKSIKTTIDPKTPGPLDNNLFYQIWEPITPNRFIVYITDEKTKECIIPVFLIKSIDRPGYTLNHEKKKWWHSIHIKVYEPINPGNILFKMLKASVFTVTVNELGPVGDVVGTWVIPTTRFKEIRPQSLNWSSDAEPMLIDAEIDWKEIIVKDGNSEFKIYNSP
jgi:hypothetical protein